MKAAKKTGIASRLVRVILAQGPCESSLYCSNFNGCSPKGIQARSGKSPKIALNLCHTHCLAFCSLQFCCLSLCGFHALKITSVRWNYLTSARRISARLLMLSGKVRMCKRQSGDGDGDGGWGWGWVETNERGEQQKNHLLFSICACHPCAGAMLIFSVSFQF